MSHIFGRIEGKVYGDYVRLEASHNAALVEILLAQQAKKTLDRVYRLSDRKIVIFRGKDGDGEYMGWRTGRDNSLQIVAEHVV